MRRNVSDKFVLDLGELNATDWRIIVAEVSGKGEVYNSISDYVTYSNRLLLYPVLFENHKIIFFEY
ncbi:hypothetical protein QMM42_16395 [Leptospira santarosai]|uniref:hypothetical protein n=1 Tax=Leptospira santarosai TaxID=28183 RepID=UPI0002488C22|nr:hypothetical protein [Leptospira santarosai]EMM75286.1 hypothetical protein LEP1GSC040_3247 [Leptospira santarosai str. 2000030832]MDI7187760.1 hypothetical protein [Leptospira santarosai]MDI7189648.1 hypothetical protein [Leptospira santarosai]MDI7201305.1 hypothetical protein [Leptospira santarosai]MDI7210731.1 hypothetical protein [Leptospira santarosai]